MDDYYSKQVKKSKIIAIIALIFGIVGITMTCCCGMGILFGSVSVLLSLCAILVEFRGNKIVIASLITGIFSILLGLLIPLIFLVSKVDDWEVFLYLIEDIIDEITFYFLF